MSVTMPSNLQMLLGLYAYLLPLLLYVLFSTLALWDLGRRDDLSVPAAWIWALLIFALPFAAALGYLFFGGARLAPRVRLLALGGGAAYLLVLALGAAIGGIT
ncbi:MAG: PLDc N-terminal domain-containing protein [Gammaproteobacteria bacterium]